MEKLIRKVLMFLRLELVGNILVCAVLILLGEMNILQNGTVEPKSQDEFIMECICIGLTVVFVPLAIKLFDLNTTRNLKRMNKDEALNSYHHWSLVRSFILFVVAALGIYFYYSTLNTSCILCALIAVVAQVFFCIPTYDKIVKFLDSQNEN